MNTSKEYVEEKNARWAALQTQINSILDSLAQRVQALEIENQATDLRGFNVDRLGGIEYRVNALAKATPESQVTTEPPATLAQLKRRLRLLLDLVGDLEAQRFEPAPLPEEVAKFRTGALGEKGLWRDKLRYRLRTERYRIANDRYAGVWGNYDPQKAQRSSWRVREANRYLTELEHRDDRRPGWIAVWGAVIAAVATICVAILAIPTEKSIYCRYFDCSERASVTANP